MLPLTDEHRQLATGKLSAFRGEKPKGWRTAREPNRYLAIDSRLSSRALSGRQGQPCGLFRFALQKASGWCERVRSLRARSVRATELRQTLLANSRFSGPEV